MGEPVHIAAFYRFFPFPRFAEFRIALKQRMEEEKVRGTILLAGEGVNGTVAGSHAGVTAVLAELRSLPGLDALEVKESQAGEQVFRRAKVRLKRELISLGRPADPLAGTGAYLRGEAWNRLISDPETLVIDARNAYETHLGTFRGATDPGIADFKELPAYVEQHLDPTRHTRIATFCTGGIRCEKFTAWLKEKGFAEVYHLQGGILQYLAETPPERSLWQGECYVFDERVAVTSALTPSQSATLCGPCGHALTTADRAQPTYRAGVSCPFCA